MRPIFSILLGLLFCVAALVLFIHDAEYIFTGNTVNLNQVLENNEELPRDKFVTYICYSSLGNYAESQEYLDGLIPLPFKSQEYALLIENGYIISAEISKKAKIQELDQLTDDFFNNEDGAELVPVEITGCLQTVSSDMHNLLIEYFEDTDIEEEKLTYYVIDTTKTRASQASLYLALFALGGFLIFITIKKKR